MEVNKLLIGVLAFFVISMIHGYRKGFLRILISLAGLILTIFVVTVISPYVSDYLNKSFVADKVKHKVIEAVERDNPKFGSISKDEEEKTIRELKLPEIITNSLINHNTTEMYQALMVTIFEDYVAKYLSRLIINAGTFVSLTIILLAIYWICIFSANIISRIPIIHGINKLLGLCAGFFNALILVWVGFFVLLLFAGESLGLSIMSQINASSFLSLLFNTNFLYRFIS